MVAATRPCVRSGRQPMTPGEMEKVKDFFRKNATAHARQACEELKMSIGKGMEDPDSVMIGLPRSKVNDRIISRGGTHLHWPAYSPYLSCLDFSFWTQALNRVVESEPETIKELKKVVEDFART